MLPANLVSVFLQLQNSAAESARGAATPATRPFPPLSVGQAVTATILARLDDHLYLADIAGQALQLNLPSPAAPGESLSLKLLRIEPQPVFALLPRAPAGSAVPATGPAAASNPGRQVIEAVFVEGARVPGPTGPTSPASPPSPAQLTLGQTVTATVLARIDSTSILADIDGMRLQLALSARVSPGEPVFLRVLRLEPRPAFELVNNAPAASHGPPALSQGAQIIQTVLADAKAPLTRASLPAPSAQQPLLSAAPSQAGAAAEQLATALRIAIAGSGVFYESHLAAWAQGRRTLAELRREPQAQWSAPASAAAADSSEQPRGDAPPRVAAALPEEASLMLRQQLETLEAHQVAWQGPVWPNQDASLTIAEEPARRGGNEEPLAWTTRLALELPRLGDIRAELALQGSNLRISIACGDAESARILDSGLQGLDSGLRAAGLAPLALTVTAHG